MTKLITLTTGLSVFLCGCSTAPLRSPQAKAPPVAAIDREAAVITVTPGTLTTGATLADAKCTPPNGEAGGFAFLAPLIGVAVDAAISVVSDQLAKAKAGRTASWPATLGGVELSPGQYCLAISRGVVTDHGNPETDKIALGGKTAFEGVPPFVLLTNLSVTGSKTGYNVQVSPQFLSYAETSAPKRGSGKKDVSVLLAFDGAAPTASSAAPQTEAGGGAGRAASPLTATATAVPAAGSGGGDDAKNSGSLVLPLGRLTVGKTYDTALLSTIKAQTGVNITDSYTVSAVVTESEDPSVVLSAFAAAFEKNKDSLSTALQTDIKKAVGLKDSK